MSASIDEDLAEGGEQARGVLASWLDDYSEGRCDLEDMQESFLSVCRSDRDAPWEALALLDQYRRRGRIESALAQSLKADIENMVFGENAPEARRRAASARREEPARDSSPPPASAPSSSPSPQAPGERQIPTRDRPPPASTSPPVPQDSTSDLAPAPAPAAPNDSGPWRKLIAERDAPSTRPGTAFVERTLLRGERFHRDSDRSAGESSWQPFDQPITASRTPSRAAQSRVAPTMHEPAAARRRTGANQVLRDRYELLSVLGRSDSGTVYRAVDRRRTHLSEAARCVAVKVLDANYREQPGALAELEREFHQAQALSHPNIVSVFDLDRDGDTYFIVMELLEGRLLADILRQLGGRPMRRRHAFAIIGSIGAALAYAHGRDIVHADLKPGNVMITNRGEVRVLEFGFARNRAMDLHSASGLHEPPTPSPAYASLERVNGSQPDASDDVYSLACIAYELLSGQHPFGGRSALLARAHGRRPRSIRGLTRKQTQALQRALLWTRGERRIGVAELLSALECADGTQAAAAPEEIVALDERGPRWLRIAAVLACVIAAAIGVMYFLPQLPVRDAAPYLPIERTAGPAGESGAQNEVAPQSADESAAVAEAPSNEAGPAPAVQPTATAPQRASKDAASDESARTAPERSAPAAPVGPAKVEFDKDTYVATENDGSVQLRVRRTGSTRDAATFRWSLRANSAEAGADFAAIGPGTEQISAGAREMTLTIPLVSDALVENTELFLVELQADEAGVLLGDRGHAAVIIVDDD